MLLANLRKFLQDEMCSKPKIVDLLLIYWLHPRYTEEHKPDDLEQQKAAPGAFLSRKSHGLTKTAQQEIRKGCLVSWVLISAVTSRWQGPKWALQT